MGRGLKPGGLHGFQGELIGWVVGMGRQERNEAGQTPNGPPSHYPALGLGERMDGFPNAPLHHRRSGTTFQLSRTLRRPGLSCEFMWLKDQGGVQVCKCAMELTGGFRTHLASWVT